MRYIIPKTIGGIGNQLFIVAAALGYGERTNRTVAFTDDWSGGNPHCNELTKFDKLFPSICILPKSVRNSASEVSCNLLQYIEQCDKNTEIIIIEGYGQNLLYFPKNINSLKDIKLKLPQPSTQYNFKNLAFLHVRRSDYLGNSYLDIDLMVYYKAAIQNMIEYNPDVIIILLSDDLEWTNTNIPKINNVATFILLETQITALETMYIMSNCEVGGICANSTLSWWGAWLNENRKIYMPVPWTTQGDIPNIYFKNVIKIDIYTGEIIA